MNYDSKRITLSYPAVERLSQAYGLPENLPSQTLAGYVERLIFECLCKLPVGDATVTTQSDQPSHSEAIPAKPNLNKLAAMANKQL
jgi:hypothetical protein